MLSAASWTWRERPRLVTRHENQYPSNPSSHASLSGERTISVPSSKAIYPGARPELLKPGAAVFFILSAPTTLHDIVSRVQPSRLMCAGAGRRAFFQQRDQYRGDDQHGAEQRETIGVPRRRLGADRVADSDDGAVYRARGIREAVRHEVLLQVGQPASRRRFQQRNSRRRNVRARAIKPNRETFVTNKEWSWDPAA